MTTSCSPPTNSTLIARRCGTDVYLIDASAWLLRSRPEVGDRLADLAPSLAVAPITLLETLFGAQGRRWNERRLDLAVLHQIAHPPSVFDDALELQSDLADVGLQGRKIPDLLLTTTALASGHAVLHYDADYDLIATVRPTLAHQWVVPRGSL